MIEQIIESYRMGLTPYEISIEMNMSENDVLAILINEDVLC